jgi:tRNA G18 (ribose-2'-O)-methylase SpoU
MKRRGYFAIGIYGAKNSINMGTLWRTAHLMGAQYIFTIGQRYKRQPSDVYDSSRHMPLFEFTTFEEFQAARPKDCSLIGVELSDTALLLDKFSHPERAIYLLGAEDTGLPLSVLSKCQGVVKLRGERSMNVATAGSIVIYHRTLESA